MYRKVTLDKISNLVRVTPTPYPFCIAWSLTFTLIKFISIWHPPYREGVLYWDLFLCSILLITSAAAWARRVINTDCSVRPFNNYLWLVIKSYEKYGYFNLHLYRSLTFREFSHNDKSQLYEFSWIVKLNYLTGFQLFMWSEFMMFFSLIWAYCHNAFSPSIWHGSLWPPVHLTYFPWDGVPQYMTALLLASSAFTNWADLSIRTKVSIVETLSALSYVLLIGFYFLVLQVWEYSVSTISWRDSIYACTFYSVTAMHGLHVIIGLLFILISASRILFDPYIRLDGLYYKKLFKKNLKNFLGLNVIIITNFQMVSGRYVAKHFVVQPYYSRCISTYFLNILNSFLSDNSLKEQLLKLQTTFIIQNCFVKNLEISSKPVTHVNKKLLKESTLINNIYINIIESFSKIPFSFQLELKICRWTLAASFGFYTLAFSYFLRILYYFITTSHYLKTSGFKKLKRNYFYVRIWGPSVCEKVIVLCKKIIFFIYKHFKVLYGFIYKALYNLEYFYIPACFLITFYIKNFIIYEIMLSKIKLGYCYINLWKKSLETFGFVQTSLIFTNDTNKLVNLVENWIKSFIKNIEVNFFKPFNFFFKKLDEYLYYFTNYLITSIVKCKRTVYFRMYPKLKPSVNLRLLYKKSPILASFKASKPSIKQPRTVKVFTTKQFFNIFTEPAVFTWSKKAQQYQEIPSLELPLLHTLQIGIKNLSPGVPSSLRLFPNLAKQVKYHDLFIFLNCNFFFINLKRLHYEYSLVSKLSILKKKIYIIKYCLVKTLNQIFSFSAFYFLNNYNKNTKTIASFPSLVKNLYNYRKKNCFLKAKADLEFKLYYLQTNGNHSIYYKKLEFIKIYKSNTYTSLYNLYSKTYNKGYYIIKLKRSSITIFSFIFFFTLFTTGCCTKSFLCPEPYNILSNTNFLSTHAFLFYLIVIMVWSPMLTRDFFFLNYINLSLVIFFCCRNSKNFYLTIYNNINFLKYTKLLNPKEFLSYYIYNAHYFYLIIVIFSVWVILTNIYKLFYRTCQKLLPLFFLKYPFLLIFRKGFINNILNFYITCYFSLYYLFVTVNKNHKVTHEFFDLLQEALINTIEPVLPYWIWNYFYSKMLYFYSYPTPLHNEIKVLNFLNDLYKTANSKLDRKYGILIESIILDLTFKLKLYLLKVYFFIINFLAYFFFNDYLYIAGLWNSLLYEIVSFLSAALVRRKFYFNKFKWYYLNFATVEWFIFFKVSAWYWHFVDIIWFIVYTICYVM